MKRRFRFHVPEEGCWCRFEVGEDGRGLRQIFFQGEESVPVVVADLAQLSFLRSTHPSQVTFRPTASPPLGERGPRRGPR